MRCEGVPQRVWRDAFVYSSTFDVSTQNAPGAHPAHWVAVGVPKDDPPAQWSAAGVQEEGAASCTAFQARTQLADIDADGADGASTDGNEPFLASLPDDAYEALVEHDVARVDTDPFRDAQPRRVCELQHRAISEHERLIECRSRQQPAHLFDGEDLGQRSPPLWCLQAFGRVAHDHSF